MRKILSFFLCLSIISVGFTLSLAAEGDRLDAVLTETAEYVLKAAENPQIGTIGGEWAVIGLARSGEKIPEEYCQRYYSNAGKAVEACSGVLHDRKYTEYSRVILALTAIGKNPENVAGYNLLTPLGDYEKTVWQGINGAIWALIALDSGNYEMPENPGAHIQATREMYVNHILESQLADGGWSLSGEVSDTDVTAMALQALAKYSDNEVVKAAVEKALSCMSEKQNASGGFSSRDTENSESCAQMIVALCELGISFDDERFVKNEKTMLDNLITYYDNGGFKHTYADKEINQMATEQCLCALAAVKRLREGKSSLYRMDDVKPVSDNNNIISGLDGKNPDVQKMSVVSPGKTFADISGHKSQTAIEALASRNIINGKTKDSFDPSGTVTRAEFAAIITRGLGLPERENSVFADVTADDWFFDCVNTAYSYGIINGVSENEFNPNGTITREEAAVMAARAAELCGMDTDIDTFAARDILAGFSDYVKASGWAVTSLAFCYDSGILPDENTRINPQEAVSRSEIADMVFVMLTLARLL